MRLQLVALAAFAFVAYPAMAQEDHAAHHPPTEAAQTPTHEQCKSVMGHKMDNRQPHDHARDKTGMFAAPNGKPLSEAEMKKMHEKCAAKMARANAKK